MFRHTLLRELGLRVSAADEEFLLSTTNPPVIPGKQNLEGHEAWISLLPQRLQELVWSSLRQDWPFLPPNIKPDWLTSTNQCLPTVTENLILLKCLLLTLETDKNQVAAAVIFVLDRFMYWYGGAQVTLKVVSYLETHFPDTPLAPQLVIRKARVMKDSGDLHDAIRVLNKILASEWQNNDSHSWQYKSKAQHDNVRAVCVQIKGQILHNLGLWSDAVPFLMESISAFENLPKKDEKGISSSLGLLGKCLKNLSMAEFQLLQQTYPDFRQSHPCHEAYSSAASAAELCPPQSLFRARHLLDAGDSILRYAVQHTMAEVRHQLLITAVTQLRFSLSEHQTVKSLYSREQSYELLKALYLASISLTFSANDHDIHSGWMLEELCIALYTVHCQNTDGLGQSSEAVRLVNLALTLLGIPHLCDISSVEDLTTNINAINLGDFHSSNNSRLLQLPSDSQSELFSQAVVRSVYGASENLTAIEGMSQVILDDQIGRRRDIGLPADPHSSQYRNIAQRLLSRPHESDQSEPNLTGPGQTVDPSATTVCSTYPGEVHQRMDNQKSVSCDTDLTDSSTPDSGCHIICDELEFSQPDQPLAVLQRVSNESETSEFPHHEVPLVAWRPLDQPQTLEYLHPETPVPEWRVLGDQSQASVMGQEVISSYNQQIERVIQDNYAKAANKTGAFRGRLWQYDPIHKQWNPQSTLAYVGSLLPLAKGKKGHHRDALNVQFLHQDEPLGRYVAKRYRKEQPILEDYLKDVASQMTARYFVTLFNQKLHSLGNADTFTKIQYLPAAHLQLLSPSGQIVDLLNVEPYLEGDSEFVKLTNNADYANPRVSKNMLDTALTFTHFTFTASQGEHMIVDLQGWLPLDHSDVLYLTDPQFNSKGQGRFSPFDQKEQGMEVFWTKVHKECNNLCHLLGLKRPVVKH